MYPAGVSPLNLESRLIFAFRGFVEPKQEAEISLKIKPHKTGERMLLVDIDAKEINDLKGQAVITVVE